MDHYSSQVKKCGHCNAIYYRHEEKKTDVNIATAMLRDAFENRYDAAILVSADSDLAPPIQRSSEAEHYQRLVSSEVRDRSVSSQTVWQGTQEYLPCLLLHQQSHDQALPIAESFDQ